MKLTKRSILMAFIAFIVATTAALAVRTTLTPVTMVNMYAGVPSATTLDFTPAAGDNTNGNDFVATSDQVLFVQNTAGAPGTFTLKGAPDRYGRSVDVGPYTVAASGFSAVYIPYDGFVQSDGKIRIDCSAATMKFAILRRP
jgi:hypothetical protein